MVAVAMRVFLTVFVIMVIVMAVAAALTVMFVTVVMGVTVTAATAMCAFMSVVVMFMVLVAAATTLFRVSGFVRVTSARVTLLFGFRHGYRVLKKNDFC